MVNYFNMFLVYANKTNDNNHDDVSYTYTHKRRRRDKNTGRKNEMRCFHSVVIDIEKKEHGLFVSVS